ncbi:MAG TPA: protein kinase [Pyrinomonadaceae bacterium]|nr:protein kinase [Pyrinomonadaceae bacterium]
MSNKNLSQVEDLFHAALDVPVEEREAYLARVCAGDAALYAEVCSLISELDTNPGFMDQPAIDLGMKVLSQATTEESMVGKEIGPYKILSKLGKGGMGEVYLAEDSKLGRKVALKFLPQDLVNDSWAKRQLEKEAQAAAKLDHPNICPVYDFQNSGEHSFIVMQFVEGDTLAELIRKKSITSERILPLARQIVSALVEAHAHGIIHRDIKPRNIMVTPGGNVKVLDFGLAKTLRPKSLEGLEDSVSNFAEIGLVPGTVRYMSPEQLRNERLDYRSDIFSVGTVLYEIVSGTNPFDCKTAPEVISAILSSDPKPLPQNGTVPKGLASIVQHCLSKAPAERYQSANELLIDLDKPEKGSAFVVPTWWSHVRSHLGKVFAALLLIVVAAAAVVYYRSLGFKKHSIAVLQISCDGLPAGIPCQGPEIRQQLIDHLSKRGYIVEPVDELRSNLIAAGSAKSIGRQFGVEAMLSGNIVDRGGSLLLKTRIESAADGKTLAENQHVFPSQSIPIVEELSLRLAFNPESDTEEDNRTYAMMAANARTSSEALRLYMRGLYYWNRRDKDNILKAIDYFNQSIEQDPAFARAHAGLAECYVVMPTVAFRSMNTEDAIAKARASAKKALQIDPDLPEAHTSLGVVQLRYDWDWAAAEKSFKRAITLAPDLASAHYWYSNLLAYTGRLTDSIVESERAKQLEPFSPLYITNAGKSYYRAREFDRTIEYFQGVLSETPDSSSAMYMLALAYIQKHRYDEAIKLMEKLSATNKWYAAALLGFSYAKVGRIDDARRILSEMEEHSKSEHLPAQERAIVYIGLGDNDNAFRWLNESVNERFGSIVGLTSDPFFDVLKSDPRFVELARKINLTP